MAATTPRTPVAPGISIGLAALEDEVLEPEPEPELVPGERVPVPCGLFSSPLQVYSPLIAALLPERGSKWLQAVVMSLVDWRLKAPRTSLSLGSWTLKNLLAGCSLDT